MKGLKVLLVIVVALIFLAGLTSIAMSAERHEAPNIQLGPPHATMPINQRPQSIPANACPAGWHVGNNWWFDDGLGSKIQFYFCCPNEINFSCPTINNYPVTASRVDKYGCKVYVCGPQTTAMYPPEYQ